MAYSRTTWVEGVTTVGPTNLNKIESFLAGTPQITTSQLVAGPPASPADNDIWVATNVDATAGVDWMFRYVSTETTYKWHFIGGAFVRVSGNPSAVINTGTQVGATGYYYDPTTMSVTVARAGDYIISGVAGMQANGGAAGNFVVGAFAGSTVSAAMGNYLAATTANPDGPVVGTLTGVVANTVVGICINPVTAGTNKFNTSGFTLVPVRII